MMDNPRCLLVVGVILGALRLCGAVESPARQPAWCEHALAGKFSVPGTDCRGWGDVKNTPFVLANSGNEAKAVNLTTYPPPRSVVVHPSPRADTAVAWQSPIKGQVGIRAKATAIDRKGGDGVSWAIVHDRQGRQKVLAEGVIDRGGAATIPADPAKPLNVAVESGDAVMLVIGRRETHAYDSTAIELGIRQTQGDGRLWDMTQDLVADIHAGNPHADSHGNAGVWHLLSPPSRTIVALDDALATPRPAAGQRIDAWTIATDDTRLTIGATRDGQLCVYELSSTSASWNWTKEPAVFELLKSATVGGRGEELKWKFKDHALDKTSGQKLTVRFACDSPAMELASEWWARPGHGPIRHAMTITNRSDKPVTLHEQPSVHLDVAADVAPIMWTFHTDGGTPDRTGIYRNEVVPAFHRQIVTNSNGAFIPYAVFDAGQKHGMYVGVEWSYSRVAAAAPEGASTGAVRIRAGEFAGFRMAVAPGESLVVPPAFVGAYQGDVDDAGNGLRKFLWSYCMPEVVRKDATYPKVQWNAFGATGDKPGSWNSVERKYYPMVDAIAPLGFEEIMLDVGWWKGGTNAPEPEPDPVDWPSGMAKAADYAHKAGLRFGLYWNRGEAMASPEGRARRIAHIKRLYNEHKADMWRSDNTGGPVVGASYAEAKGFYAMFEQLLAEIPNFEWEDCCSGGRIKDFGAMKYASKVFITDTYAELHIRQAVHDSLYAFPAAQLEGCVGSTNNGFRPKGPDGMRFAFRSTSMGAPEWFIDAPNGGNGAAPWTEEEKAAVKGAVATYKSRIRPLVRNADVYHILPRPDGRNWDGIQYFDPATQTGVAYLFKPAQGIDTVNIRLRGVQPAKRYRIHFEDGSNPAVERSGKELLEGIDVTLKTAPISELLWIEAVRQ